MRLIFLQSDKSQKILNSLPLLVHGSTLIRGKDMINSILRLVLLFMLRLELDLFLDVLEFGPVVSFFHSADLAKRCIFIRSKPNL